uniref:Uncharacterized protein n=1 Tax=Glossina brevipalpis TaxID=37001 RepID=A0A1A9W312_9MUSC
MSNDEYNIILIIEYPMNMGLIYYIYNELPKMLLHVRDEGQINHNVKTIILKVFYGKAFLFGVAVVLLDIRKQRVLSNFECQIIFDSLLRIPRQLSVIVLECSQVLVAFDALDVVVHLFLLCAHPDYRRQIPAENYKQTQILRETT